ncbi:efflux RND transporter permease subunit, partial [candidate division KSB1 bacterium]
ILKILLEKFFSLLNKIFTPVFVKFDKVFGKIVERYRGLLEYALENKAKIVSGFVLVMILTLVLGVYLGREILPEVDQRQFYVTFKLPEGSTLDAADETALDIIDRLNQLQGIETVFSNIGIVKEQNMTSGEAVINSGNVFVKISENGPDTKYVIDFVDNHLKNYGGIDYAFKTGENTLSKFLAGSEWDISIKIFGEDFEVSKTINNELTGKVENISGVRTVSYSYKEGKPEIRLRIDKDKTNMFGVSAQSVANIVKNYLQGDIATQFNVFDKKVDILVTAEEKSKTSVEDLLQNFIPAGENLVPLREFVKVEYASGPNEIVRENQARYISLNMDVEGRDLAAVIGDIEKLVSKIDVPRGYKIVIGGENEEVQRSFNSLVMALLIAMALVYMIMAAQFESLLHPFTIMFSIPMAFVGVIVILFATGQTLNVMSGIGLIILIGIAVNDSIIMVDFINQRRREGMELKESVIDSGLKRIRPILMTTITTILGLLPMAIGFGAGAELRKPLALTVIGGLFTSTVLTLVIIPVLYTILENLKAAVIKKT